MKKIIKKLFLIIPILPYFVLFKPYWWINQEFLVDKFGCGCDPSFNANDFTKIFWYSIFAITTVLSIFLSKNITIEKKWLRVRLKIIYIVFMALVSFMIVKNNIYIMMWD